MSFELSFDGSVLSADDDYICSLAITSSRALSRIESSEVLFISCFFAFMVCQTFLFVLLIAFDAFLKRVLLVWVSVLIYICCFGSLKNLIILHFLK